ncbi:hypothetical protein [Proteus mirabilis]|uniref:hypothetical protein n=1 Tax=Proteus mirabilis TaxID=584 RepID=UPI000F8712B1|nr:hypothetical protein [Proteus mirabilis]MDC9734925.1 hypothetical protein [Proteus mirabilis]MDC9774054.1 hypothetical protein [Proteus mirabilis]MDC9781039.1 hypothetical protein [Proteus mirabilis]RUL12014.1 hypothetical protein ELP66_05355 [Proteus mirabilis]
MKTITIKISLFVLSLFFPLLTKALVIPDNGTGYIGELTPPQSYMLLYSSGNRYGAAVGVNNVVDYCSKNSAQWQSFLFPFPGSQEGEYGLKLYNKNASEAENRENYLVAAINGTLTINSVYSNNGTYTPTRITLRRGKEVSRTADYPSEFSYRHPMCWFGRFSRVDNTSLRISSYSIYAVGHVKPGIYDFVAPVYFTTAQTATEAPPDLSSVPFSFGNGPIHVLKTCNVSPASSTNIQFAAQLAQNFKSAKLLEQNVASMLVSCPHSGNMYVTLKPYNELVNGSKTGMTMSSNIPLKDKEVAPYITVSDAAKKITNAVCNNNSSEALEFYAGQSMGKYNGGTVYKLLSFNLCANGNIPTNTYKGSIDVSFLIE